MLNRVGMEEARLAPHVPTSVALMRLLDDAPADRVSLAWLIGRLGKRSFGLLVLQQHTKAVVVKRDYIDRL